MRSYLLLATLLATAVAQDRCSGTVTLTNDGGILSDGPSEYVANMRCTWLITVPGDYISFSFSEFSTEYSFDGLLIYDNHDMDGPPRVISGNRVENHYYSEGNQLAVVFISDDLINDDGFVMHYYSASCPTRCGGHGQCSGLTCTCDATFSGSACDVSEGGCAEGCNYPHGECNSGVCECAAGWHGLSCNDPYCEGNTTLTASSGTISDHVHEELPLYRANSECQWVIEADSSKVIALTFSLFDMGTFGFVRVYDGPEDGRHLVGTYGGNSLPPLTVARSGRMVVEFEGGGSVHRGFTASYETWECGNCSGHGHCWGGDGAGSCHCDVGWGGAACSERACTRDCHAATTNSTCGPGNVCNCTRGYAGLDCGICVGANATETEPAVLCNRCEGSTSVSEDSIISDGPGEYTPDQSCQWNIATEKSAIALSFEVFELEGASVSILTPTGQLLRRFTGDIAPPVQALGGGNVRVSFDGGDEEGVPAEGFEATVHMLTCPADCSGNGVCVADGKCVCDAGFTGVDCATTTCIGDCGASMGRGSCVSGRLGPTCSCGPGFFGPGCETNFCYGTKIIKAASGTITDHSSPGPYLPLSNCEWKIDAPDPTSNVTLVFDFVQTEEFFDRISVAAHLHEDDLPFADGVYLGYLSGYFAVVPFSIEGPSFSVAFTTDGNVNLRGFTLSWYADTLCPGRCSGNGLCIKGACSCTGGHAGADCSTVASPTVLSYGTTLEDVTVARYGWRYYRVDWTQPDPTYRRDLRVSVRRKTSELTVILYYRQNGLPSFPSDFDGTGVSLDATTVHVVIPSAEEGTYYFGVYGYLGGDFDITLEEDECVPMTYNEVCGAAGPAECGVYSDGCVSTVDCGPCQNSAFTCVENACQPRSDEFTGCSDLCQGSCENDVCICSPGQAGENCDICVGDGCDSGSGNSFAFIWIGIAILVLAGMFGVVSYYNRYRREQRVNLATEMSAVANTNQLESDATGTSHPPAVPEEVEEEEGSAHSNSYYSPEEDQAAPVDIHGKTRKKRSGNYAQL